MDLTLRNFIEKAHRFVDMARPINSYDAGELFRWIRDLEQFPSVEAVPAEDWDAHLKHIAYCNVSSQEATHLREALLSFVNEQKHRVLRQMS